MRTLFKSIAFIAVAMWVLGGPPLEAGGGRGGGGGHGGGGQGGHGGGQGSIHQGGSQHGHGGRGAGGQQQRIQLPDEQRNLFKGCAAKAGQARKQARQLAKMANTAGFDGAAARRKQENLRQDVGIMFQDHDRLMGSFGDNARGLLQDRTRRLEQDRKRLETHLQAMDRELGRDDPDRARVRSEARELKRAMSAWQRHYRQLGDDLGVATS